jgi:protocatechuate 3,4-dioxygenase alpha subunit
MLVHAFTRIYFDDEPTNMIDPVLRLVPAERRATVIARRRANEAVYRFDICLQGRPRNGVLRRLTPTAHLSDLPMA